MKEPVVIKLSPDSSPEDVGEIFATHEYGPDFAACLHLEPADEDRDELRFDEWFPLHVELHDDHVLVNYRVMFLGRHVRCWRHADRQVVGSREPDRLVFQRHGSGA